MVKVKQDLTGKVFGRLTILEQAEDYIDSKCKHYAKWLCKCECGNIKVVSQRDLLSGRTQSCGCYNRDITTSKAFSDSKRKYNDYKICNDYVIMYTLKGEPFYIDLEDLERVKKHCWHINNEGYASTRINKTKCMLLHRFIMDCPNDLFVDHIGGIQTRNDNRKCNLRIATKSQNNINVKIKSNNSSGTPGVFFDKAKGKWCAKISIHGHAIHLGYYIDKEEAIRTRKEAEEKYFGEWSYSSSQKMNDNINIKENDIDGNSKKSIKYTE